MVIETDRFLLRELTVDDVSASYLGWLSDPVAKNWILTAKSTRKLSELREYVQQRTGRQDVLFLGIFSKLEKLHIGNIKYEPILCIEGRAEMGILIGDPAFRGKRVFAEVLAASATWLKQHRHIYRICLGVEAENLPAMSAYRNAGFVAETYLQRDNEPDIVRMVLNV